MNLTIQKLTREHLDMLGAFSCTESKEELLFNAKERRRIIKHSKEMEDSPISMRLGLDLYLEMMDEA